MGEDGFGSLRVRKKVGVGMGIRKMWVRGEESDVMVLLIQLRPRTIISGKRNADDCEAWRLTFIILNLLQ